MSRERKNLLSTGSWFRYGFWVDRTHTWAKVEDARHLASGKLQISGMLFLRNKRLFLMPFRPAYHAMAMRRWG